MRDEDPFLKAGLGTRSTLRLGPAVPGAKPFPVQESVLMLPLRVGPYRLAIEATRVIEVVPGGSWTGTSDATRPVATADLFAALGLPVPAEQETVLARAD